MRRGEDLLSDANSKGQLVFGGGQGGGRSMVEPLDPTLIPMLLVAVFQEVFQTLKL